MQIYNSMDRHKEEFVPVTPGTARVYVCGITAYDYCHIGHARSAIVFDILIRHLRKSGLDTLYIRNFTDIDDKIINRAKTENRDWREVADTYIKAFHEDMDKLGVIRPDIEPKATEYIEQIQDICKKLIAAGNAYATKSGDVYFRVRSDPNYGKLSKRNLDEMQAGARVAPGEEKEGELDFALWKAAKQGEPSWSSPWGAGRPGWHIECSAMNQPYLPLDIHGGGQDLLFPHHENEIAQSEAICHCELAKYWVHNGFVRIDEEKMSKSLGNFKTIRDILQDWLPETLRFFLLGKHYRSPIDYSIQAMLDAEKGQKRVYTALAEAKDAVSHTSWKKTALPQDILDEWAALPGLFNSALEDDLNSALAIGYIFANVRIVNRLLEDKKLKSSQATGIILEEFLSRVDEWQNSLGIFGQEPKEFLHALRSIRLKRNKVDQSLIDQLLEERLEARKNKDFVKSDAIRDKLSEMGIQARDTPQGQTWDMD